MCFAAFKWECQQDDDDILRNVSKTDYLGDGQWYYWVYEIKKWNCKEIKLQPPLDNILVPGSIQVLFILSPPPVIYSNDKLTLAL